jgi:hypothetical protein
MGISLTLTDCDLRYLLDMPVAIQVSMPRLHYKPEQVAKGLNGYPVWDMGAE